MFKVGQRVKIVNSPVIYDECKDREAVIEAPDSVWDWFVSIPGVPCAGHIYGWWRAYECDLRPLTDPKADAFIASIKSLRPYEEPLRTLTEREMDKITGGGA